MPTRVQPAYKAPHNPQPSNIKTTIIMTVDKKLIREYLDELHISTRIDEDGDMVIVQSADEDFGHDVVIFVIVNNNRLSYAAGSPGYQPAEDPYFLATAAATCPPPLCAMATCAWNAHSSSTRKYRKPIS